MQRATLLAQLHQTTDCDLLIIGGGATGLGLAHAAAAQGLTVVLLEAQDFASGTSSRSSKLLHGGVRYLAQGHIALVRLALRERHAVLQAYPHLASPLPFVMPAYRRWQRAFYGLGLWLYDKLAGSYSLGRTQCLSPAATLQALPGLKRAGLKGGVRYVDGQFDDARLAFAVAQDASQQGALLVNYVRVRALQAPTAAAAGTTRGPWNVTWQNMFNPAAGKAHGHLQARCVVNAAGVWVDDILALVQPAACDSRKAAHPQNLHAPQQPMVRPSQGVHLVVSQRFMPGQSALLVPRTADGRVLFIIPWLGALLLGTTDTPRDDAPREPEAFAAEVDFILREAAAVLQLAPTRADIQSIWVGLRPLVQQADIQNTAQLSREHTLVDSAPGLLTVTGGKWTTYRAMAQEVLAHLHAQDLIPAAWPHSCGYGAQTAAASPRRIDPTPPVTLSALSAPAGWHSYGPQAEWVQRCANPDEDLGHGLSAAMVRYAVRHEAAITVEDVLARRSRLLFLDAKAAASVAQRVASLITEETGQDAQLEAFLRLCQRYQLSL